MCERESLKIVVEDGSLNLIEVIEVKVKEKRI